MNHDRPLSAEERDQLAQELLELHFGCHEDPARLEARLANEPALRSLQQEVLQQAKLLERAVRPDQAPLRLREPQPATPSRWRVLRSPFGRLLSASSAAAAVVLGCFVAEHFASGRYAQYQQDHLHLTVSAPRAVPAGAPWSMTVQTKDLAGNAVDGKVTWQTLGANGEVLAASEAPVRGGQATVAMTADPSLRLPHRVVVTATTATDSVRQVLSLSTATAGPLVHVATDRPVYQPGEPVFVRAVLLDRVTRLPLATGGQYVQAQLLDARGAPVGQDGDQQVPGGVASFLLQVPADSAGGPHQVRVTSANGAFPDEVAEIVVRSFRPPQLQKQIVLDRMSYAPGARGAATVNVTRLAAGGGGAIGASARGALVVDGTEVWSEQRVLGALGEATFAFVIPKDVAKGAARFVATIDDGGIVETEVRPFVVPTGKVLVAAFPEGGDLIAGVECGLYLEITDPLGRPVDENGEVIDERGRQVAKFRTQHQGRVKLSLLPRKGSTYRVRLVGQPEPFALPEVKDSGVALRLLGGDIGGSDIGGNDPLRLAVAGRGDGPWLLGVFCRGVLVGQTTLRPDANGELRETAVVALPLTATGVLRTTVFDRSLQPIAERLVRRLAHRRLDVGLSVQQAQLSPGDAQQVRVRTTDETGQPVAALVGLSVSDRAALSLGSEPRLGLVDQALLFADVERMENLGDFFLGAENAAAHADLLLGTRGWRRFVWRNDAAAQAAIATRGPTAVGTLAREGFSQTPQVASNLDAAQAAGHALARSVHHAERRRVDATGFAAVLLALLAIGELVAFGLRRMTRAAPWLQGALGAGVATAVLLIVVALQVGSAKFTVDAEAMLGDVDFDNIPDASDFITPQVLHANPRKAYPEAVRELLDVSGYRALGTNAWAATNLSFDAFDGPVLLLGHSEYRPIAPFDLGAGGWTDELVVEERELQGGFAWNRSSEAKLGYLTQWRQRQYAHQHTPSDERRDFTSTIYWNTLVATDATGQAAVTFATSDAVTTWRVHADAHAPTGIGRLGQGSLDFATRLPLHVEAKLPDEVSAVDRLQVPVTVVATDTTLTEVTLTAVVGDGLQLPDGGTLRLALQQGRGRVLLPITVGATIGTATIQLDARSGRFVDRVQHRLTIAPRGFPHRRSLGGSVEAGKPSGGTVVVPADPVAGSGRVTLKVYPSPISALTEGLDGILREPHGCFEQASSSNYPNTLVLNLLEANGDNIPTVAARAHALLPRGYAKITGYECKQKGYEWFGADPGHEALTAYGLLQFHDMAKVYAVDAAMVDRTRAWLLGRRDGKGNFVHQGLDHHSFGGRSQVLTNAYVVYALLQSGTPATGLRPELDALLARLATDDPYELALIACALHLAQRPEASAARQKLASLQRPDGSLHGTTTSITCSGDRDLIVESTGFAVLAWLGDPSYAANVRQAIAFVQTCRSAGGTFGATQATIVALRALTAYATANRTMRAPGTLRVFAGDRRLAERAFSAEETNALTFELWDLLPAGEHTLRLELEGAAGSVLPWACDVTYHAAQPADDPDAAVGLTTQLRTTAAEEGQTVAVDVTVVNRTDRELPTPIAVIGLPAGGELPTRVLEDLQKAGAFASWELRGRELVLYWRTLAPRAEQKLTLDLITRVPGETTGPASRAWLYYTSSQKRWAAPLALTVRGR